MDAQIYTFLDPEYALKMVTCITAVHVEVRHGGLMISAFRLLIEPWPGVQVVVLCS